MQRKIISFVLVFSMVLCMLPIHVSAASSEAQAAANRLYELGLFGGTGTDSSGNPIFDLDRAPTRHEAVTMLVRLLGKDSVAKSGTWTTPFSDIADWAKPYVGYAYANKLTGGTSATTFSGNDQVNATQYITFVLRTLGYSSESDFQWDKAWELSDKLGLTDGRYKSSNATFTRGDIAIISASALDMKLKGSSDTLLALLQKSGAIKSSGTIAPLVISGGGATQRTTNSYLYAVMDTAAMTTADLAAVGNYLASITDANVLVVDAAMLSDAQSIYNVMQQDVKQRNGEVAGVQIFGTASMVPSFQIGNKAKTLSGYEDNGMLLTDLFYGNFANDSSKLGINYSVMEGLANGWNIELVPKWPVVRLPLSKGEYEAFFTKYKSFASDSQLKQLDIVNFCNPIFKGQEHIDDMGRFIQRADQEFHIIDVAYRIYGNQRGQYPVNYPVLGGFEAENMLAENKKAASEFIIDSHGDPDCIVKTYFVDGKDTRETLIDMSSINTVFASNPYYLDAVACSNGANMEDNLTTKALTGQCVGVFSATAMISNNGINWQASLSDMAKSNFFYFYYNYLKALHEGKSRSQAFFKAQKEYGTALVADSKLPLRGEGNVQFNLYNLLAYHNFGVIEPDVNALTQRGLTGFIKQASERVQKPSQVEQKNDQPNWRSVEVSNGNPVGRAINVDYRIEAIEPLTVHSLTKQELDNGYTRFTLEYTAQAGRNIRIITHEQGKSAILSNTKTTGTRERFIFDLTNESVQSIPTITVSFYTDDNHQSFVSFDTRTMITDGVPVGEVKSVVFGKTNRLANGGSGTIYSITAQLLDNDYTRFVVEYAVPAGLTISVFDPPSHQRFMLYDRSGTSNSKSKLTFDISYSDLDAVAMISIIFSRNDSDRLLVYFNTDQLK